LEKYISLYPPEVRNREGGAAPVHSAASSSVSDEKREKLREWVRERMRTGEMSSEPETLEPRESVETSIAQQWEGSIDKGKRGVRVGEEMMARLDVDAPDDFFEDDTGNGDSETGEPANTRISEIPMKPRPEKAENHPDRHSKPAGKDRKKAKHKKYRKAASQTVLQDGFLGEESEE
jgi:hypothetical protein